MARAKGSRTKTASGKAHDMGAMQPQHKVMHEKMLKGMKPKAKAKPRRK